MNGFVIDYTEVAVFIIYIVIMMGFGVYYFVKSKGGGEKEYYLGNREMGPWVSALSAGTSDMSAWVLMGLPGAIYWFGMSRAWIAIGLAAGYILSWIFVAPRLRQFSIAAQDSITLPQFFTNRFVTNSKLLQCICAVVFIVAFAAYSIAHIVVCGVLFNLVFGMQESTGMILGAVLIIFYTFLGGFKGVSVSDFFQGSLMLLALMAAPFFALFAISPEAFTATAFPDTYWNLLFTGQLDWGSISHILTGFGWGLGYFGMPHIIVRYMAIRKQSEVKKSAIIAIAWNLIILTAAVAAGILGRVYLGSIGIELGAPGAAGTGGGETVFIEMARRIFPAVIAGVLLSAILSAAMSSTDSKLLVSSSSFTADVYKPLFRKNASHNEMIWIGRFVVVAIAVVATAIALSPGRGTIMGIVGNAWGVFGAAFGPSMLLALYWKRFNLAGAITGIVSGTAVAILWIVVPPLAATGVFGIVPAFFISLFAAIGVTLATPKPGKEVEELFDKALAIQD
ncbi:MAG: sodium/proline symporter [Defluviitaleaceae bacterium]|nr:sodium/proline symporter [Defluviitaleaceae bacterium]MCL2262909.1 sodium/proline symporter [Defluviitaleaceae bacterium]